jgi:hypothetical protein
MLREVINALAQQSDLNLRRASIALMEFELLKQFFSLRLSNSIVPPFIISLS